MSTHSSSAGTRANTSSVTEHIITRSSRVVCQRMPARLLGTNSTRRWTPGIARMSGCRNLSHSTVADSATSGSIHFKIRTGFQFDSYAALQRCSSATIWRLVPCGAVSCVAARSRGAPNSSFSHSMRPAFIFLLEFSMELLLPPMKNCPGLLQFSV